MSGDGIYVLKNHWW